MNQQNALALVQMLNSLQPYVPPIIYNQLAALDAVKLLVGMANGAAQMPEAPRMEANGHDKVDEAKANNGQC